MCTARKNPIGRSLIQSPQGICAPPSSGTARLATPPGPVVPISARSVELEAAHTNLDPRGPSSNQTEPARRRRGLGGAPARGGRLPPGLAAALAAESVDVHALIELVERGCRPRLAARILAPLGRSRRDHAARC